MLGQASGYASTALGYLAAMGDRPALVKEIAEGCNIPAAYLAKIVHQLAKQRVVLTQRGVGGGVMLARAPEDITLMDVCRALGDPILEARCMLGVAACADERACPAHEFWKCNRASTLDFLERTTVADIAAFEAARAARAAEGTMSA